MTPDIALPALKIGQYDSDDDLIEKVKEDGDIQMRIYKPDNVIVVLGRGSKPETELNIENCLKDGVTV